MAAGPSPPSSGSFMATSPWDGVRFRRHAALLVLACLAVPSAAASSATVADASGDAAPHLDILQVDVGSSAGDVTLTMALDDLDVSQGAAYYAYRLLHDGVEFLWYCNLAGDGSQLTGSCAVEATTL